MSSPLTNEEITERETFYRNLLGPEKFEGYRKFNRGGLWPVSAYDEKVQGLLRRGFADPRRMIQSMPAILGYSLENVDRKMKLARRLKCDMGLFLDYSIAFTGVSAKRYIPLLRCCRSRGELPTPGNVFRLYRSRVDLAPAGKSLACTPADIRDACVT